MPPVTALVTTVMTTMAAMCVGRAAVGSGAATQQLAATATLQQRC